MVIYEENPRYDYWLKALLYGITAVFLIGAVILFGTGDQEGGLVLLGTTVLYALIFKAIMPSKFQVYQDRLKITLGGPLALSIPFSNIREVKRVSGAKGFSASGWRLATSMKYVIEITRHAGMSLLISPGSELFVEQLQQAMRTATSI